jgi:hypothetical protein
MECSRMNSKTVVLSDGVNPTYQHRVEVVRPLYVGAKVWYVRDDRPLRHGIIQHWSHIDELDKASKYTGEDQLWPCNVWVRWDDNPQSMSPADSRYLVLAEVQ